MTLETLISTYGYAAIAIGTFFEGETVLVLAGLAAHQGYLKLPWVVICGFFGTLCGDQLYFYFGRVQGMKILEKRSHWRVMSQRVFDLLRRHQSLLILGFRFLYGFRTVTPFLLGASGIPPVRFALLNSLGALFWAISIGVCGYFFGHVLEFLMGDIQRYEARLFFGLAMLGVIVWSIHWFKRQKVHENPPDPGE